MIAIDLNFKSEIEGTYDFKNFLRRQNFFSSMIFEVMADQAPFAIG